MLMNLVSANMTCSGKASGVLLFWNDDEPVRFRQIYFLRARYCTLFPHSGLGHLIASLSFLQETMYNVHSPTLMPLSSVHWSFTFSNHGHSFQTFALHFHHNLAACILFVVFF